MFCHTILEIYGKNPTRHRLTCACTCLLTDSTAAVVAAAAFQLLQLLAVLLPARCTVLLLLACCAGAVQVLVLVLLRLLLRIGTVISIVVIGAGIGTGKQGVSKPAAAGPARSQQEEGLGESRVANVPSDAGSAGPLGGVLRSCPKLGGALLLNEELAPAASATCERSASMNPLQS